MDGDCGEVGTAVKGVFSNGGECFGEGDGFELFAF